MLAPTTDAELNWTANRLLFWRRPVTSGELRRAVPVLAAITKVRGKFRRQRKMRGRKWTVARRGEV